MKYANSLKIMNSFSRAPSPSDISRKRVRELCERMGRVHLGARYICLPKGGSGHACALMLEAVIKDAGHRVGRIVSSADFDARGSVFVDGKIPSIDDFNKAVTELKSAAQKSDEQIYLEEATFALGLLLCKLGDCDFIILQGMSDEGFSLDAVCAPYDLIIMPTVYDTDNAAEQVRTLCEAVRRGTREVVSGNQKSEIYNLISNSCALNGIRLYIPVKAQLEVTEVSPRKLCFNYGGREGYTLRSPSHILRDVAITVIESALALRRGGVKIPWSSVSAGVASLSGSCCFDLISASPLVVSDSASCRAEVELLLKTADELWGEQKSLSLCVGGEGVKNLPSILEAFEGREVTRVAVVGENMENCMSYPTVVEAAEGLLDVCRDEKLLLCVGGVGFASRFRIEFVKKLNL